MTTTLTPNLKLRIDSKLTSNAKYNLQRIDLLGATFLVDSTNTLNIRSQTDVLIEPNSADIGGSGISGAVSIGTANHKITSLNIYATDLILDGAFNLKDQAATSTGKLRLLYDSTLSGSKDDNSRILTFDLQEANRQIILGGNLIISGGNLTLTLSGNTNVTLPSAGVLVARDTSDPLSNKTINVDNNNIITNLRNSSIATNAAIDYLKLNLLNKIVNADIYSNAAIAYSKLNLTGSLIDSDISPSAAIEGSKIVPQFTQSVRTTGMLELNNGTHFTKIAPASSGQTQDLTFKFPNSYGTSNQTITTDGAGNLTWATTGTVTSVDLSAPAEFHVSGNPVTGAGTLTFTKVNQVANKVYAGPEADGPAQPSFRSLVSDDIPSLSKTKVGLGNVDNTSDLDKPVSTATQSALDLKYDASNPANYVNATQAAEAAPVQSVAGKIGSVTLNKSDVGLGNVDNTADISKPVSTATQLALNDKYDVTNPAGYVNAAEAATAAPVQSVAGKVGAVTVNKSDVGLGLVPNVDATNPANIIESSSFRFVTDTEKATWNGKQDALGFTPENVANRGIANGYAPLNASGKIENSYLNTTVMNYHGTWDASTNTPALADGMVGADPGDVYIVSVAGTQNLGSGSISFNIGDWVIYDQALVWQKVINSNAVTSVNGAQGAVTINALSQLTGDVTAGPASGSESKVATIAAGAITDSKISNSAAITVAKLAAGTEAQVLTTVSGVPAWAAVPVSSVAGKTGTVTLTKSDVGLSNVDNTSDANKPVSTATQSALNLKYDASNPDGYVNNLQAAAAAPVQSVAGKIGIVTLAKSDVGLGNVDNTSDANKPVSTEQAAANNAVQAFSIQRSNHTGTQSASTITGLAAVATSGLKADVGLGNVDNTSDANKPISNATQSALDLKYDASNPANYVNSSQAAAAAPVQSVNGSTGAVIVNAINQLTGDITAGPASGSASATTTIAAGAITDSKVSASAAIAVSKLAAGSDSQVLTTVAGVPTWAAATGGGGGVPDPTALTNTEATRLGYKTYISNTAYNSGITPSITGSAEGSVTNATLIPYQVQDGSWRLKGNIPSTSVGFYASLGIAFGGTVSAITIQSDGKILIGGLFQTFNGLTRARLIRLNSNGTEDTAFYTNLGTGFANSINSITVQSDGKILVGGSFTTFNGNTRNYLVRLNSDGTEDTAFYTNLGTNAFGSNVNTIAIQSDGKILVGGAFTTLGGVTRNRIVRLNSDGTIDTAFYTNLGSAAASTVNWISVQSDGKILVVGAFGTFNSLTRTGIVRLNSDGTEDSSFYTNLGTGFTGGTPSVIAIQSDGKILLGGTFTTLNGNTRNRIVRLNSSGTDDSAFYTAIGGTAFGSTVNSIAIQSDGKILVGGAFTGLNALLRNYLVRLNSSGSEDSSFYNNMGTAFNTSVSTLAIQSDGKILVGGAFNTWSSITRNRMLKLNSDGTEAEISIYTYTLNGITFSATDPVSAAAGLSVTSSGSNIITAGPYVTGSGTSILSRTGAIFDVALSSKPTWAY